MITFFLDSTVFFQGYEDILFVYRDTADHYIYINFFENI